MASAEQHNRLRGPALAVLVMDRLRDFPGTAKGEPVTLWDLNRLLCEEAGLHGPARNAQYSRLRRTVTVLTGAGLLRSEKKWEPENERYVKYLWPCSTR